MKNIHEAHEEYIEHVRRALGSYSGEVGKFLWAGGESTHGAVSLFGDFRSANAQYYGPVDDVIRASRSESAELFEKLEELESAVEAVVKEKDYYDRMD